MFQLAFRRRVLFSLGPSLTTGRVHPTYAVHLKTSMSGGPAMHGYPDPQYMENAREELRNCGVTLEQALAEAIHLSGPALGGSLGRAGILNRCRIQLDVVGRVTVPLFCCIFMLATDRRDFQQICSQKTRFGIVISVAKRSS